jgi:drug/metabolite transporter (DMT)-like permease
MRLSPSVSRWLFLIILFLATYALADGIRYQSIAGIIMAVISLLALAFVYVLFKKLSRLQEEEATEKEESI